MTEELESHEEVDKRLDIHTIEYCVTSKENETLTRATKG